MGDISDSAGYSSVTLESESISGGTPNSGYFDARENFADSADLSESLAKFGEKPVQKLSIASDKGNSPRSPHNDQSMRVKKRTKSDSAVISKMETGIFTTSNSGNTWTPEDEEGHESTPNPRSTPSMGDDRSRDILTESCTSAHHSQGIELVTLVIPRVLPLTRLLYVLVYTSVIKLVLCTILMVKTVVINDGSQDPSYFEESFLAVAACISVIQVVLFLLYHKQIHGSNYVHLLTLYKLTKNSGITLIALVGLSAAICLACSVPLEVVMRTGFNKPVDVYYLVLLMVSFIDVVVQIITARLCYITYRIFFPYKASTVLALLPPLPLTTPGMRRARSVRQGITSIHDLVPQDASGYQTIDIYPQLHELGDASLQFFFEFYLVLNLVLKAVSLVLFCAVALLLGADNMSEYKIQFPEFDVQFSTRFEEAFTAVVMFTSGYTLLTSAIPLWSYRLNVVSGHFKRKWVHSGVRVMCDIVVMGMSGFLLYQYYHSTEDVRSMTASQRRFYENWSYYIFILSLSILSAGLNGVRLCVTRSLYKMSMLILIQVERNSPTITDASLESLACGRRIRRIRTPYSGSFI